MNTGTPASAKGTGRLIAGTSGNLQDPHIVLVESADLPRFAWDELSLIFENTGRSILRHALDGTGPAGALRACLDGLIARPAVVCARGSAASILRALGGSANHLISALIVVGADAGDLDITAGLPGLFLDETFHAALLSQQGGVSEPASDGGQQDAARAQALRMTDFLETCLPASPVEYTRGSDSRILRDAFGCFATGITVVTTLSRAGDPVGITANSFTSVSLDPALLLVCIARSSTSSDAFANASHFAINILHVGQQALSSCFARKGEDRFGQTDWKPGLAGTPLLSGSLALFECTRHQVLDGGDHIILLGAVERARFEPRRDPLLYFRGKYRRLQIP